MLPRERVARAFERRSVDVPPLEIHRSPAGLFEHGEKLAALMRETGHDFGPLADVTVPVVPPEHFDADVYKSLHKASLHQSLRKTGICP